MKKLLSMFLALALALTLAVPALAVNKNSPDYLAGFEDGYNVGWTEGYDTGYDEGYSDGSGSTDYDMGYNVGWEDGYCWGLEDGTDAAAQNIYEEPPCAQPRDDYDLCTYEDGLEDGTADGYASGYEDGFYNACGLWGWQVQELTVRGGVVGQVNVLYNDQCIAFPDVAPKIVHSRTMIPIRAVSEGMDKLVDWNNDTETVTISEKDADTSVCFAIGSQTATVCRGGDRTEITMDCAPYLDHDRTMVPVRFLSEALGYTVLWDADFQTVVIVDAAAAAQAVDASFTRFNEIAAQQSRAASLGDRFKLDYALNGTLTLYDETGKATNHKLDMDLTLFTDKKSFRMDAVLDLKSIADAMIADPDLLTGDAEVSLKDLLSIDWSAVTATFLMDESGHCWLNAPALNLLLSAADQDAWIDLGTLNDLTDESGSTLTSGMNPTGLLDLPEDATVGQVIVAMCAVDEGSFYFYQNLNRYAALLEAFCGDSAARGSGSSCTWTLLGSQLLDYLGMSEEFLAEMGWSKVDLSGKLTMNTGGNSSFQYDLRMESDLFSTVTGSLTGSGTADSAAAKLTAAMADLFSLVLTMECTAEATDSLPDLTPPADGVILPLEDLLTLEAAAE